MICNIKLDWKIPRHLSKFSLSALVPALLSSGLLFMISASLKSFDVNWTMVFNFEFFWGLQSMFN